MINSNSEVLKTIQKEFLFPNSRYLKIPNDINFYIDANTVKMKLTATAVCANMQKDDGAFEGWALVLKRWGKYEKVIISWDKPDSTLDYPHYQRFLFRLKHFQQDFKWFDIDLNCKILLEDSKLKMPGEYLLNMPGKRKDSVSFHAEAVLEDRFVNGDLKERLINVSNATYLYKQLPVGVFKDTVSKKDSIFTFGKSAIDIWGFNKLNELLVFELKVKGNKKVGIISELYFYVYVLQMIQKEIFKHQNCTEENKHLLKIAKTTTIRAYFLAPELHALLDNEILKLLNNINPEISYHYIKFNDEKEYELTLDVFN